MNNRKQISNDEIRNAIEFVKIRLYKKGDEGDLAKLLKKCFGKYYRPYLDFNEEYIIEKVDKKENKIFVATDKNKIIGSIRVRMKNPRLAVLRQISVTEKYRNKGIGTELIKKAISYLKTKKVEKVVARSDSKNKTGMIFLVQNGFVPESVMREHYKKKEDIIEFALFLR